MTPLPPHRTIALGFFRSSVFFIFAVAAFSESDQKTQTILIALVFLLDVVSWHLIQMHAILSEAVYNRVWINTLADRIFVERILSDLREGMSLDIEWIRKESINSAHEDIKQFLSDSTVWFSWGDFRKTLLGIGYFIWYWTSYGVFYGTAAFVGNLIRSGY